MKKHISVLVLFIFLVNGRCFSQSADLNNELKNRVSSFNNSAKKVATEKLYIHFDKSYYAVGDTVWFKAYLLNSFLTASDKSGIINIDIANDSNKVIKQYRLSVVAGVTFGNISLDEKEGFTTGTYTIRAYTNWMRNFGDNAFFYKSLYIASANQNSWLINRLFKDSVVNDANVAEVRLQFSDMDKKPFMVQSLALQVINGSKNLYKQQVQTDLGGMITVSFAIPQEANNLAVIVENEKKDKRAVIPVILNRVENTDVQFLPEGGNLVAGLPAHIGFKAISEDGTGTKISGTVINHNQQQVAEFKSLHNGMGSFDLSVKDGESYTAKVTLPNGAIKEYPLPAEKKSGMILHIKNPMESDYLEVAIGATNDIVHSGEHYFLIGKARGIVCYAAIVSFRDSSFIKRKILKTLFPNGITRFTIMTTKYQPLNERLVFIDRHDNLNIQLMPDKPNYSSRESIALHIKVTDNKGNPVSGNFSLAVTDDALVKSDTLNSENLVTRMKLTTDLKGNIETPGYYLPAISKVKWLALDNLLLTQGWVGYEWQQVFNPPGINYQPELEFAVKGSVTNVFNKPVKGTHVLLFSKSPTILMDTLTNSEGKFVFDQFPRVDTPIFILKAVNKNGKSFNVGINMDEVKPPDFTKPFSPIATPWYVNSDSCLLNYAKNNFIARREKDLPNAGHLLKEVKIKGKKIIKGSQNLNGPGNADLVLDENDLEKAGKKNWLELFEENIKGFKESDIYAIKHTDVFTGNLPMDVITKSYEHLYLIRDKKVKLVIDGILLSAIYNPLDFTTLKNYLESHNAEDIKGIEVNSSNIYAINYAARYGFILNPKSVWGVSSDSLAFIEITTRSGHGPVIDNTPGMYLYKPLAISQPKQFYKPKYTVKDTANHVPDLRSTIDWEPNITTGANGEATVSFFTADKPSTYTVIMEGTDMNGNLGYKRGEIDVSQPKDMSK